MVSTQKLLSLRKSGFRVAGVARKSPASEVHARYLARRRGVRVSAHGFPIENAPRARVHRQDSLITTLLCAPPTQLTAQHLGRY